MTQTTEKTIRDIQTTISADNTKLVLTFANGEVLTVDRLLLSDEMVGMAIMHGLKQKLVDAGAIARNTDTGATATIEDKYNAVKEVFDRITGENPQWNKNRETGNSGTAAGGLLVRALIRLYPDKTPEALKLFVDSKTKSEQAAMRALPKIATVIDTIRAEKTGGVNSDDLLAELDV